MPYKIKTTGFCVYKLTSPDGLVYIGTTSRDPRARWNSGHGYRMNKPLFESIKKHGWENIKKEVLFDNLSKEEAHKHETEMISFYNSVENGFNHTQTGRAGGVVGHKLSEESRRKCSEKNKFIHLGGKSPRARKVNQYTLDGVFVKTWDATTDVQRNLGIAYSSVVKCCAGVYKTAGGYIWEYA